MEELQQVCLYYNVVPSSTFVMNLRKLELISYCLRVMDQQRLDLQSTVLLSLAADEVMQNDF